MLRIVGVTMTLMVTPTLAAPPLSSVQIIKSGNQVLVLVVVLMLVLRVCSRTEDERHSFYKFSLVRDQRELETSFLRNTQHSAYHRNLVISYSCRCLGSNPTISRGLALWGE